MEILSLAGGGVAGFLFRYLAEKQKAQSDLVQQLITKQLALDDSADRASVRDNSDSGSWIRRFICIFVIVAVVFFPFILALLDRNTIIEYISPPRTFLGLFDWGNKPTFVELPSYLLSDGLKAAFLSLIGYYFGQSSVAKR